MAVEDAKPPASAKHEIGTLSVLDVPFARAQHFIDEHGDHVFESLEFDVYAGGPTFDDAFTRFALRVMDYAVELIELHDVTDEERVHREQLALRMAQITSRLEQLERSRRTEKTLLKRVRSSVRAFADGEASVNKWLVQPTQSASLAI